MNDEYKKMLERFEQICQNAKKELCGEKEKEQVKEVIEQISYQEKDTLIEQQDKEIERLNNIINELEKWLNEECEATIFDYHNAIEDVLNKLQELKGNEQK